mmetsp:Transcript_123052/g.241369  ORF Transcript_123052/g.241369 Transcript_123052/m.241369 type:complete len:222 (-) Transcript_123052:886-1551(-)
MQQPPQEPASWSIRRTRRLLGDRSGRSGLASTRSSSSGDMRPSPSRSKVRKAALQTPRSAHCRWSSVAARNSVKSKLPEPSLSALRNASSKLADKLTPCISRQLRTSSIESTPSASRSNSWKEWRKDFIASSGNCRATAVKATRFIRACSWKAWSLVTRSCPSMIPRSSTAAVSTDAASEWDTPLSVGATQLFHTRFGQARERAACADGRSWRSIVRSHEV